MQKARVEKKVDGKRKPTPQSIELKEDVVNDLKGKHAYTVNYEGFR